MDAGARSVAYDGSGGVGRAWARGRERASLKGFLAEAARNDKKPFGLAQESVGLGGGGELENYAAIKARLVKATAKSGSAVVGVDDEHSAAIYTSSRRWTRPASS